MMPTTMLIIAGVLALVATVLAFIYVVPEKRREKLGAFGKFLHDTCNFKYLMVEKILQALYIFTTAAVIIFGVLMLFRTEYNYWTGDRIWMGGYGLLIIILGPIAIRLSYELMMMAILLLKNVIPKHLECITAKLVEMGVEVEEREDTLLVRRSGPLQKANVKTMPYPGFPTDAQPLVMAMAAVGRGTSIFVETIFENRYKHAEGLQRLGANIKVEGKVAIVEGVEQLRGAPVMSHDLRGGAALVVAGLCAKGRTEVGGVEYIRRGYENLAGNLASSWARSVTIWEAVSISSRAMSGEEVILMITPLAPAILVSSRGLEMAAMAACSALSLPLARPTPMWA